MYEFEDVPQNDLEEIDINIRDAKRLADAKVKLDYLRKDEAFKKIFLEMYLETESARITSLLSAPGFQTEEAQNDLLNQLRAISHFGQYMTTLNIAGGQANEALKTHEETREAILAEGLN